MPFNIPKALSDFKKAINYKKGLLYFGVALLIIDVLSLSYFRILERFELVTLDFRYNVRLLFPQKVNPDIAIIEIGEDTLKSLGKWPLPRDYHASLIDVLNRFKARMIVFDILFCEPTAWDEVLVASTRDSGNVYYPFAFRLRENRKSGFLEAAGIDAPIVKDLEGAARGTGFINKMVDIDGKVRRVPILLRFNGRLYKSLAFKVACDYLGVDSEAGVFDRNGILFKHKRVPIDENGYTLLNFAGRWVETFAHYSYLDILASYKEVSEGKKPRMDLDKLAGKICFVGLTATGTQEMGPVPIQSAYPMLGIHANLFNMLTEDSYVVRPGRIVNLLILVLLSLVIIYLTRRFRPSIAFLISLAIILLLFMSAVMLFALSRIWIDIVCPSAILFGVYVVFTLKKYIAEVKAREKMQKELAVASSIQKCFLPAGIPSVPGLDIAADMKTAKEVGGDLYDFIKLDDNRLGVMIGDVSGKGIPAALFMAKVDTLFRVYSKNKEKPSRTIEMLNNEISSDERAGLFTTLVYAIFDTKDKRLLISDAGHLPAILLQGDRIERISIEDGMAIGIMENTVFSDRQIKLSGSDVIIFYTDGVSETRNAKGKEFGITALTSAVKRFRNLSAQGIVDAILNELRLFQGKAIQHDDTTIIAVKVS
jgi:adenylate cyclase